MHAACLIHQAEFELAAVSLPALRACRCAALEQQVAVLEAHGRERGNALAIALAANAGLRCVVVQALWRQQQLVCGASFSGPSHASGLQLCG